MNSNTTEERIKEQISSLDTLQAGIVFGKEDAWDKLQTRMDAEPVRKAIPLYRIAAIAALLLTFVTIAISYLLPQHPGSVPNIAASIPNITPSAPEVIMNPANQNASTGQDHPSLADSVRTAKFTSSAPYKPHHNRPSAPPPAVPSPNVEPIAPIPTTTATAIILPAPKPAMKVVHINDLGREEETTYSIADAQTTPYPHVLFRMKVIHINELSQPLREEDYRRNMNNNTAGRSPLFSRPANDHYPFSQPRNFLRINLSQN